MLADKLRASNIPGQLKVYNGLYTNSGDANSYTFGSCNLSNEALNRLVVCVVSIGFNSGTAASQLISSVTIGGVSATFAVQSQSYSGSAGFGTTAIVYANVPTGATGNISVTVNSGIRCLVGVYSLYNLYSFTPTYVSGLCGFSTSVFNDTFSVLNNSITIAGASSTSPSTGTSYIYTGVSENINVTLEAARIYGVASSQHTAAGSTTFQIRRDSVTPNYYSAAIANWN